MRLHAHAKPPHTQLTLGPTHMGSFFHFSALSQLPKVYVSAARFTQVLPPAPTTPNTTTLPPASCPPPPPPPQACMARISGLPPPANGTQVHPHKGQEAMAR